MRSRGFALVVGEVGDRGSVRAEEPMLLPSAPAALPENPCNEEEGGRPNGAAQDDGPR